MKLRNLIAAASIALLPLAAGATTLIVPVAGTGPGYNGSRWQSELTFHSTSALPIPVTLRFHDQSGAGESSNVVIQARTTGFSPDVVARKFNRTAATGAIEITVSDADASKLTITSRTSNVTDHGELGQDIPVINAADAAKAGDLVVVTGPFDPAAFRFNFGLYATTDTKVRWQLVRYDGAIGATTDVDYQAGQQMQYNNGVATLFNSTAAVNDVVHASILSGSAIFYGSLIDQLSGDPNYVNSARTREDLRLNFAGVDRNGDGTVDIPDANRDGVLDGPVIGNTIGFPVYFRIVVNTFGSKPLFEIISSTADARLVDDNGTVQMIASAGLKGTTGEMKVRVTIDGQASIITIPLKFE